MASLWETYLPIVQDQNDYGGNFTSIHISRPVLDEIEQRAANGDQAMASFRDHFISIIGKLKHLQDHQTFSAFFEAYYEAVFFLIAGRRGIALRNIPAGSKHDKTPDFVTSHPPEIRFEVKTINVADPANTYATTMEDGLKGGLAASEQARKSGVGTFTQIISPHGVAKDRREVIEQIMKKIDGNVKHGQYADAPTFLVVSGARTALHDRANELRKRFPITPGERDASGQLWTVAAHRPGEEFYFCPEDGHGVKSLGALDRAGILIDHPFIAGIVFIHTEWNMTGNPDALDSAYQFNGIYNLEWEKTAACKAELKAEARRLFERLCHEHSDTDDTRSLLISP